jgi:glutamate mutase epsilon subunit
MTILGASVLDAHPLESPRVHHQKLGEHDVRAVLEALTGHVEGDIRQAILKTLSAHVLLPEFWCKRAYATIIIMVRILKKERQKS